MKRYDTMLNIISIYNNIQTDNINHFSKNLKNLYKIQNIML